MKLLPDLFLTFAKIGAFTFGGGYAMISLIDHECVEKKKWITSDELMDITVVAESTPGPIAINCATYTGYRQKGFLGALIATLGMVLPSFLIVLIVSMLLDSLLQYEIVAKAFSGVRVSIAFLIILASVKMTNKMMKKTPTKFASMAFVVSFFAIVIACNLLKIAFSTIALIICAGVLGFLVFGIAKIGRASK